MSSTTKSDAATSGSGSEEKITPDDILHKLQSFQDGVQQGVNDRKQTLFAVGGGIALVLLLLFFLMGRSAGRKKSTLVEIKRF